MSEHITLTELVALEQAAADAAPYVPSRDAIPRLAATLRAALALLAELVYEYSSLANCNGYSACVYCERIPHRPTCPIVRARELLKEVQRD